MISDDPLRLEGVSKSFTMHLRGGTVLSVLRDVTLSVPGGSCVVLGGRSGTGKSSILKIVYGNYRCDSGRILIRQPEGSIDLGGAEPRTILRLRQSTIGYVSQFLSVIPRVSARDIVAAGARDGTGGNGLDEAGAREVAEMLLARLNVPKQLWDLPPATFSGGEQQRLNIARGFAAERPILLLDEPTASLDAGNRRVVIDMLNERKARGCAILGVFHDRDVRDAVADRVVDVSRFAVSDMGNAENTAA